MKCPYCNRRILPDSDKESQKNHLITKHREDLVELLKKQNRDVDDGNIAQVAGAIAWLTS